MSRATGRDQALQVLIKHLRKFVYLLKRTISKGKESTFPTSPFWGANWQYLGSWGSPNLGTALLRDLMILLEICSCGGDPVVCRNQTQPPLLKCNYKTKATERPIPHLSPPKISRRDIWCTSYFFHPKWDLWNVQKTRGSKHGDFGRYIVARHRLTEQLAQVQHLGGCGGGGGIAWSLPYTPRKLTWNLKMMVSNRNLLFQGFIFRFHVSFAGCIPYPYSVVLLMVHDDYWDMMYGELFLDTWREG